MAFPALFPTGAADLNLERPHRLTPVQYFKFLLEFKDGRFANDPRFRFFAFNTVMRHEALRAGSIYVRRNEDLHGKTVRDLREMARQRPGLARDIMFYGTKLHGTRQYWGARLSELLDMINQLGVPTIFMTLSAADLHWPDLFRLMLEQYNANLTDGERILLEELTEEQRRNFIADQPYVPSVFFMKRAEYFMGKILKLMYPVKDFWWRFEWQFRGSPHIHSLLWLSDAPDVTRLKEMTPEEFATVVDYFHNIVSAWNVGLGLPPAQVHPCRKRFKDVAPEDRVRHLGELLNRVQRHLRCTEAYCLRRSKGPGQPLECRFKFPFQLADRTEIIFDEKGEPQFIPARNDSLLNNLIERVISAWIGNMDGKPVLSKQLCANYLAKYSAKPEKKSKSMQELFEDALRDLNDDDSARKAIQRRCVQSISERDFSSQEIIHLATSQKLMHSSRNFVRVNFFDPTWVAPAPERTSDIQEDNADDPDVVQGDPEHGSSSVQADEAHGSLLERYPKRPAHLNEVSLWTFARDYKYDTSKKRYTKLTKFNVVCVNPRLRLTPCAARNEGYYRQQVLLHVPWRTEEGALSGHGTWRQAFTANNVVPQGEEHLPDPENNDLDDMDVTQGENLDEWMTVARHLPNQNVERVELGTREMDLAHDWASEGHRYGNLDVLRTFLQAAKAEFVVERTTSTGPAVLLSAEQQVVMDILSLQIEEIVKPRGSTPPRLVIVQGKAGCGKSTVIKAMTSTLDARLGRDSYRLMAFTAVAALGINGETLHSGLQLPIRPRDFAPLTGERAKAFQDDMENVRFLFIDEYSMVSLSLLGMVERRCSEAHPYSKELFGNMHIYLIGDLAQLPPVCSKAIYSVPKDGSSEMDLRGHYTFAQFKHAVVLSQSKRQTDTSLCSVLDEIGRGCCSVESYKLLQQRFSSVVPPPEQRQFRDAMHIFSTNSDARAYNIKRLVELNCPVARIPAVHNNDTAKKAGPDEAGGLESFIYLSVGALVMLRANLWTKAGLVNGALGTVAAIVYADGQSPPNQLPFAVLVRFQRYTGPVIPVDGSFPTLPLTRTFKVKEVACSREQVPLRLAWGSTVHSAQGLTLDRVVVNVGKREFQSGLSYVAMTRGKTWDTLLIDPPFVRARLSTLHTAPSLKRRLTAIQKIVNMAHRTKAQLGYPTEPPLPRPGTSPSEPPGPPPAPSPSPPPASPAPLPLDEDVVDVGGVMARVAVVPGNGHCLFVSLFHQLNGTMPSEQQVTNLRWRVVTHIRQRLAGPLREEWEQLLVGTLLDVSDRFPEMENGIALSLETRIDRYLNALKNSEWGAMETVRAVSEMENASITVFREAGVANVFHQGDQRHLAVVFRLRPIQEGEGANLWNHYDSFLDFV
ncbi:hypothetical protein FOCC_FOCC007313 [Frankliniella occidentalis]|uniref:ATP-dependent DNA helicase n=1 Tax=Frankliniella occidentalis TaxID=133901 RepID=A0A9C6TXU0_FRAOC|nr:uncharacterized protein LOC127749587 [Frankliniella occidentalis]KAE8745952.1 hypothetical protein FOCC_FOCC007313 [Frankliniella occidentalis]